MKSNKNEYEWLNEFQEFINSETKTVPYEVSEKITSFVKRDLMPPIWKVFSKLISIHLAVGTLSLAVCDQFGFNPFQTNFSLSHLLMKFGYAACMIFCGFFFLSVGLFFGRYLLTDNEFRVVNKTSIIQVSLLSVISLFLFWLFGASITIDSGVYWMIGALIGGIGLIKLFNIDVKDS